MAGEVENLSKSGSCVSLERRSWRFGVVHFGNQARNIVAAAYGGFVAVDYPHKLDLRTEMIPRGALIGALERELGRRLTHEHRHYLANQPVHCGDALQLYMDDSWIAGRYEWSGSPDELPIFYHDNGVAWLDDTSLLRWPER